MSNISKYAEAVWAVSTGVDDYGDTFVKRFRNPAVKGGLFGKIGAAIRGLFSR